MINSETFERAIEFAVQAHKGQKRKGDGKPYITHPISVMNRVYAIKKSSNIYLLGAAAILHDTVEDCGVKIEEITEKFGLYTAALVKELTLDKSQYQTMGKDKYLASELIKMSSYALVIKLCDRLDNVCDLDSMKPEFIEYYVKQTHFILDELENKRTKLTGTHKKLVKSIRKKLKTYDVIKHVNNIVKGLEEVEQIRKGKKQGKSFGDFLKSI